MTESGVIHALRTTISLMQEEVPELQDKLLDLYCDWQYGQPLEQMLIEGDENNPDLQCKQDYIDAMTTHIMSNVEWGKSFLNHVNLNIWN